MRIDLNNISASRTGARGKDPEGRQQGSERAERRGQGQPVGGHAERLLAPSPGNGRARLSGRTKSTRCGRPSRTVNTELEADKIAHAILEQNQR